MSRGGAHQVDDRDVIGPQEIDYLLILSLGSPFRLRIGRDHLSQIRPHRQVLRSDRPADQFLAWMQYLEIPTGILVLITLAQQDAPGLLERQALYTLQQRIVNLRPAVSEAVKRAFRGVLDHLFAREPKNLAICGTQQAGGDYQWNRKT